MFDGRGTDACMGLESIPVTVTPSVPSPTPSATIEYQPTATMPTPTATATPPPKPDASETYYHVLMGDVGTSASYMHTMGNEKDGFLNYISIHVDGIPEDEERYLSIRLDCLDKRGDFQWDIEFEVDMIFNYNCGRGINVSVMGINPFIPLVVYLPPGDWSSYTFYLEVLEE
jgi:hypothetical protein